MIDLSASAPMYLQLTHLIREKINSGEFVQGNRLPSETEFGKTYGVSRITIRQALGILEQEGLLERIPGRGTFVKKRKKIEGISRLSSFSEASEASGFKAGYKVLECKADEVPANVSHILRSPLHTALIIKRILLAKEVHVGMHISYLPIWLVEQAPENTFTAEVLTSSSLHAAIERSGIRMNRSESLIEPAFAKGTAVHLDVPEDHLVLKVKRTIYDSDDRPIMYEIEISNPELYNYRIETWKQQP